MVIFHSYVTNYQRVNPIHSPMKPTFSYGFPWFSHVFPCRFHGDFAATPRAGPDSIADGLGCQDIWETHVLPRRPGIDFCKPLRWDLTPEIWLFRLVVYLPLWKIWVKWDDDIPNIWEKMTKHVPNHQPDYHEIFNLHLRAWSIMTRWPMWTGLKAPGKTSWRVSGSVEVSLGYH